MRYEPGMQIIYDVLRKGVLVEYRGSTEYLTGPIANQREAIAAAEAYCRDRGWKSVQRI